MSLGLVILRDRSDPHLGHKWRWISQCHLRLGHIYFAYCRNALVLQRQLFLVKKFSSFLESLLPSPSSTPPCLPGILALYCFLAIRLGRSCLLSFWVLLSPSGIPLTIVKWKTCKVPWLFLSMERLNVNCSIQINISWKDSCSCCPLGKESPDGNNVLRTS